MKAGVSQQRDDLLENVVVTVSPELMEVGFGANIARDQDLFQVSLFDQLDQRLDALRIVGEIIGFFGS